MKHASHIPTLWIVPRLKDEVFEICTWPIPIALQSRVKPPFELPEVSVDAFGGAELDSAWISSVGVDNATLSLEMTAVGEHEEEDLVIASVNDDFRLFEEVNSTEVVDCRLDVSFTAKTFRSALIPRILSPSSIFQLF